MDTVLVTGGSGAIARLCVIRLLGDGYAVRTTVRNLAREGRRGRGLPLRAARRVAVPDRAAQEPRRPDRPRTRRHAARAARQRRGERRTRRGRDPEHPDAPPYVRSKTIAERAAWDFMKTSGATTTLAVVNPVAVIGPVAGNDPSYSFQLVSRLLAGTVPAVPRLGFSLVDVRDIADLHVRAMTSPAAAGQRFIGENGFFWRLGDDARRVPTRKAPDFLIRFLALFDKSIPASELGERTDFTSEKARTALGWAPRPIEDTIADCGRSLLANGLVRSN